MHSFLLSGEHFLIDFSHLFIHTIKDTIHLLPFLFISYLIMEFIEHKTNEKMLSAIQHSGKFGPFIGSVSGIIPQCGFSALASTLYAGKVITLGTLIAVFLSTSDEMLPVMISRNVPFKNILIILTTKFLIAILAGFIVDLLFRTKSKSGHEHEIEHLCEDEHCQCQNGIFRSSLHHTLHVFAFIFVFSLALNITVHFIGEDKLSSFILGKPIVGQIFSAIIGLIPNCISSVAITELYIEGAISAGAMLSGLLVGAGIGVLVLFRTNKHIKENLKIVGFLFIIGVLSGILLDLLNFESLLI